MSLDVRKFHKWIRLHDADEGHPLASCYDYGANKSPLPPPQRSRYQLPDPTTGGAYLSASGRGVAGLFTQHTPRQVARVANPLAGNNDNTQ